MPTHFRSGCGRGTAAQPRSGRGLLPDEFVAEVHAKDLAVQDEFGVSFLEYRVDEDSGTVVCLSEAPSAAAVNEAHGAAHGLLADHVYEVTEGR